MSDSSEGEHSTVSHCVNAVLFNYLTYDHVIKHMTLLMKDTQTVHQTTLQPKVIHVNRPSSAENYLKEVEGLKVTKALRTCCKVLSQL